MQQYFSTGSYQPEHIAYFTLLCFAACTIYAAKSFVNQTKAIEAVNKSGGTDDKTITPLYTYSDELGRASAEKAQGDAANQSGCFTAGVADGVPVVNAPAPATNIHLKVDMRGTGGGAAAE